MATFTKDNTLYYRAVAGSYSVRANADAQINKLKSDGYSAFIEVYNK
ncbi:MAG: SPOR domain-containing protein [Romboutsia sp.]